MIGNIITNDKGEPVNGSGKKLTESNLVLPQDVKDFYQKFQRDYINAWTLQRKPLDEFDGVSLLQRTKLDQESFGAFVGAKYIPKHKRWRWVGRKNTARNKVISILAHLITGMLFPYVFAQNEKDEEDKMTARVMAIMVEEHLKRAKYEAKFMYFVLSLLVNPASYVMVEYLRILQTVKQKLQNGEIKVVQAIDEVLSGLNLHSRPMDEILLGDLYSGTGDTHRQPHIFDVQRVSYDYAKNAYAGKYFHDGVDLFDYVEAGKTRWIESGESETLFDVDWTEADGNFVQIVTGKWRDEDIEVTFVGGVPMCNYDNIYNNNPFKHRRFTMVGEEWMSVPIYNIAMGGFEPIDPSGRFAYYKSASFKEYWEDKKINEIDKLLVDGVKLDVMKPVFASGVAKFDSTVMAPGATIGMPQGATIETYSLGSNIIAAQNLIKDADRDMSESTQDKVMQGTTTPGVTATQSNIAVKQAQVFLGVAGLGLANLVTQIGELAKDCIIQYETVGELDAMVPEALRMKYKAFIAKGKDNGKDVTNRILFTDEFMGKDLSKEEIRRREWKLFNDAGGKDSDQRIYTVNPFRFARSRYSMFVDADQIVQRSMGNDKTEKELAFEKLMDPRVLPFVNPEAVVNDFVIDEYAKGNPDKYKAKKGQEEVINTMLGLAKNNPQGGDTRKEEVNV